MATEQPKSIEELLLENQYACFQEKDYPRCDEVASYYEVTKRVDEAFELYKKTCDNHDYARACYNFARLNLKVNKDQADVSFKYYDKACSLGDKRSCYNAGVIKLNPKYLGKEKVDPVEAMRLYERGCKLFEHHSCFQASQVYRVGYGDAVERDMEKAALFAGRACEYGNRNGCINAHVIYRTGDGVAQSDELAQKYKHMGIKLDLVNGRVKWEDEPKKVVSKVKIDKYVAK